MVERTSPQQRPRLVAPGADRRVRTMENTVVSEQAQTQKDRLWVNEERTVLVRLWPSGKIEVARRDHPSHTWGPPVYLEEER